VTVTVEIPSSLSSEERALLERMAQLRGEMPKRGESLPARLRKLLEK